MFFNFLFILVRLVRASEKLFIQVKSEIKMSSKKIKSKEIINNKKNENILNIHD